MWNVVSWETKWHHPLNHNWEHYLKLPESDIHTNCPSMNVPLATTNTRGNWKHSVNIIMNRTAKNIYRAIYMRFYWVHDTIQQTHFHLFWDDGRKNLLYDVTNHHPIWYHITMWPIYLKQTTKDIDNSKDCKTRTRIGCARTYYPRVIQNLDNTLKGIHNLVPKLIRN